VTPCADNELHDDYEYIAREFSFYKGYIAAAGDSQVHAHCLEDSFERPQPRSPSEHGKMPAELRSGSKKPGRGRGRGAGTSTRGTNPTPRGRGGTASRGRAVAAPGAGEARQASGDAVAVAEEEQAEPNPATLAAEPPAADMRGKEEGETDKDAPPGDEKGKDEDASTAPLPEKVRAAPPPPPPLSAPCVGKSLPLDLTPSPR